MFTGIIEATATVLAISHSGKDQILRIARPRTFDDLTIGCSIACNGICLTVTAFDPQSFNIGVMNETIAKTNARTWHSGTVINLERALKLGNRLDGHWVQGHIDTTLTLIKSAVKADTRYLTFELLEEYRPLIVPQGSIAIDGVSLTIAGSAADSFSVAIIGHTLSHTTLSTLQNGGKVNVEFDILGKYIHRYMTHRSGKISMDWLNEQGF